MKNPYSISLFHCSTNHVGEVEVIPSVCSSLSWSHSSVLMSLAKARSIARKF